MKYSRDTLRTNLMKLIKNISGSIFQPDAIYIFGSYLRERSKLGDVDLIIGYSQKFLHYLQFLYHLKINHQFRELIRQASGLLEDKLITDFLTTLPSNKEYLQEIEQSKHTDTIAKQRFEKIIQTIYVNRYIKKSRKTEFNNFQAIFHEVKMDQLEPIINKILQENIENYTSTEIKAIGFDFISIMTYSEVFSDMPLHPAIIFKRQFFPNLRGISISNDSEDSLECVLLWSKEKDNLEENLNNFKANKHQYLEREYNHLLKDLQQKIEYSKENEIDKYQMLQNIQIKYLSIKLTQNVSDNCEIIDNLRQEMKSVHNQSQ